MEKKPRKSYKRLYLAQLAANRELKSKLEDATREIARVRSILAPYGNRIIASEWTGTGDLVLNPLDGECFKAALTSVMRWCDNAPSMYGGFESLVLRNRRVLIQPE